MACKALGNKARYNDGIKRRRSEISHTQCSRITKIFEKRACLSDSSSAKPDGDFGEIRIGKEKLMKKLLLLLLAIVAVTLCGVQAAHALDGCCCDGSWKEGAQDCE